MNEFDGSKGEAVFAWTTQEDIALMQKGLCGCYYPEQEADINIPLYTAPQAECAPRAKERLWLMVADNFTRDEFEQAFVECAPRADLMQVANRVAAEFRDLASKLPDDVLAKLFSRADVDTAGAKPIAWLIDPGAGSAKDRLQSIEPSEFQLAEINRRGGSVTPLVAAGASNERADAKPCTCHPDDNPPVPCAQKYALGECRRADAEKDAALTDDDIRRIFMANGFTIKEGQSDLKPYVYAAARAILAANKEPQP